MTTENYLSKNHNANPWLKRFSRISAWALLITVIVLVISGWGITQTGVIYKLSLGLIDRGVANSVHRETTLPLAIFFLSHALINIKLMIFQAHPSRSWLTNTILIVIGVGIMAIVIYMQYYRSGG
jgi:hypothetical protein